MTTLLLDTHAYVWALTDPARLSDRARAAIEAPSNVLLVSAATAWEMAIKHRAGKWPEAEILLAQHDDLTGRLGARSLHISAIDAIRAGSLDWKPRRSVRPDARRPVTTPPSRAADPRRSVP